MLFQHVRVWWWKWRYVERILNRAFPDRTDHEIKSAWYLADCGWDTNLQWHGGDVKAALAEKPRDQADEELSYWTAD